MKFKRRFYRKFKYNRKRSFMFIFLFLLCLSFGLGYSLISTDLNIFGTTVLKDNRWSVYFDNIQEIEGSVSPTIEPEITNDTTVSFSAKLKNPGDKYEFLIDIINNGTIDAKIASITLSPELTDEQQNYFNYSVKYESGVELDEDQALDAGTTETLKVVFEYLENNDNTLYPSSDQTFNISVTIDYVQGKGTEVGHPYLYNILMNEAESGGLAKKYTGEHHDSFTEEPSKDIYHWYATSDAQGTQVLNKNNVIFANHCWQMIRTTDTGGVKLIYNGEVDNNQCLDTRGKHVGYDLSGIQTLNDKSYWYGTDYTYDSNNKVFSISGDTVRATWTDLTYQDLIDKYTCKKTTVDGTCSTLYYVVSYNSIYGAYCVEIESNSHYSQFGKLYFQRSDSSSIANIGYMTNKKDYTSSKIKFTASEDVITESTLSSSFYNYWYADDITYDSNTGKYSLVNPYQLDVAGTYPTIKKLYTFRSTSQTSTSSSATYIISSSSNVYYYITLSSGNNLSYYNDVYKFGSSYVDNGNGTYTISNITSISRVDWINNYNKPLKKYWCKNYNNNICDEIKYVMLTGRYYFNYENPENTYKFANGFMWDGEKYILNELSVDIFDFNSSSNITTLSNYHYTCLNTSGECESIYYITYTDSNYLYYYILNDGKSVENVLNEMLYDDDVNVYNSLIKTSNEKWYEKYLLDDYDKYIEDTIYCDNRTIWTLGAWNPNGGSIKEYLHFAEARNSNINLYCTSLKDRFSINNDVAKLSYKIGLISSFEMKLLNNDNIRKTNYSYFLISPDIVTYGNNPVHVSCITSSGAVTSYSVGTGNGLRPAISLKPKTIYLSGDGSKEHPYVITE